MSANTNTISNTVVETVVETKAPRVKKPTLSAKYSKFLVFGYGLVQSLQAQGVLTDEGVEAAYGELKLLSSVEDQTQFYESVLGQSNETGKVMRKYVTQRLAPPKAPRAKKPRAKKAKETLDVEGEEDKKEKKEKKAAARTKKATRIESDTSNDIVAELVDAANAEPTVSAEEKKALKEAEKKAKAEAKEAKEAEKKAKAEAKEAEKKAKAEAKEAEKKANAEAKEAEKKAKAEAKKDSKKESKKAPVETSVETVSAAPVVEEDEDEEIHTQEIDINGKTYLIDNENNLYSCVTHDEVGKYDAEAKTIIAIAQ